MLDGLKHAEGFLSCLWLGGMETKQQVSSRRQEDSVRRMKSRASDQRQETREPVGMGMKQDRGPKPKLLVRVRTDTLCAFACMAGLAAVTLVARGSWAAHAEARDPVTGHG